MIIDLCRINLWIPESQSSITCHWIKFLCRTNRSNWVITGESMKKFVKILRPKDTRVHKVGRPWPWRSSKPWMHGGCSHVGMNPAGKPCSSGGPALEVQEISWRISDIVVKGTKDQEMSGDIGICWSFFKIPGGILKRAVIVSTSTLSTNSALATHASETWGAECRYPFSPDRGVQHASSVRNNIGATEAEESLIYPCEWKSNLQARRGNHAELKMTITVNYRKLYNFSWTQRFPDALYYHVHRGQCSFINIV